MKNDFIGFRIEHEKNLMLTEIATSQNRSVSNFLQTIIDSAIFEYYFANDISCEIDDRTIN